MDGSNTSKKNENILVFASMLDWGLGHTTRCIPILNEFINQGFPLIIGCTALQKKILQPEIPQASFKMLKGYNIRYSPGKLLFTLKIILQLPKIFKTCYIERKWLKIHLKKTNYKSIIVFSDNRPGFYHHRAFNIYMTHQLTIHTGSAITTKLATLMHRRVIRKFNECWIPDTKSHSLSGQLSKDSNIKVPKRYIGPLSRLRYIPAAKVYDIAFVLSGPEPQRTILENVIFNQVRMCREHKIIIVRGKLSGPEQKPDLPKNVICHDYLATGELNRVMCSSKLIVCRSGYSGIMDLVCTHSKAVLIPTPGQGEQQYLAALMSENKIFMKAAQNRLVLTKIVEASGCFPFTKVEADFDSFRQTITGLTNRQR